GHAAPYSDGAGGALLTCLLLLVGFVAKTATGRNRVGRGMATPGFNHQSAILLMFGIRRPLAGL
ncbi:MAG: hypothetical protein LBS96_05050, partial [Oscillospiraceae bacterium]|nr:hypothetical protein [Oscillospiraceae bacterium]